MSIQREYLRPLNIEKVFRCWCSNHVCYADGWYPALSFLFAPQIPWLQLLKRAHVCQTTAFANRASWYPNHSQSLSILIDLSGRAAVGNITLPTSRNGYLSDFFRNTTSGTGIDHGVDLGKFHYFFIWWGIIQYIAVF